MKLSANTDAVAYTTIYCDENTHTTS